MQRVYKSVAEGCMALQDKLGTYKRDRISIYKAKEKEIKEALSEVPTQEEIISIINKIGLNIDDFYKVYSKEKVADAVKFAKDLKDRYTVLWLYYDICGLEEI